MSNDEPPHRYDESGWLCSLVEPYAPERAYSVLSPQARAQIDIELVSRELGRIAQRTVSLRVPKRYLRGASPTVDAAELVVARRTGEVTTIALRSFPRDRASSVLAAARVAAASPRSSGMEALLPRTERVLQLRTLALEGHDPCAVPALAAALAQLCLGPVLPPERDRLLGPASLRSMLAVVGAAD